MKKKLYKKILLVIVCSLFFLPSCFAGSAVKEVRKGNKLYQDEQFDEALQSYNKAKISLPDSDIVNFNISAALFKKQEYAKAIEGFTQALITKNSDIEAKANYNIGNAKYKLGKLKENADLSEAISLYRQSLDYYKRAIDLDQKDKDSKYNHEFVEKKLKLLLDKQKQQQQSQADQKEGEDGQEQASDQQESSQEGEEKEAAAVEKGEEGAEEEKEQQPQTNEDEQKEMSEEEARMILERYEQDEVSQQELNEMRKAGEDRPVLKDW